MSERNIETIPPAPCDSCARVALCAASLTACRAFRAYVSVTARWGAADVGRDLLPLGQSARDAEDF